MCNEEVRFIRFVVVSDRAEAGQNLCARLSIEGPSFVPVGSGRVGVSQIDSQVCQAADLILIDFDIEPQVARELTRRVSDSPGGTRAVLFDVDENRAGAVADLIEAGASAYVVIEAPIADLVRISAMAREGEFACSPQVAFEVFRRVSRLSSQYLTSEWIRSSQLSKREVEILQLLSLNRDNQSIADSLFLSVATVKNHVHKLLSKLGARSRVEAVAYWQMHRRNTGA